jgi:hypothetical protein
VGLFGAFARAVRHKEEQIVNREEHFSLTHLSRFISSDVDFTDLVSPLGFEMRSKQARHTLICGKRRKVISHC